MPNANWAQLLRYYLDIILSNLVKSISRIRRGRGMSKQRERKLGRMTREGKVEAVIKRRVIL